MTGYETPPKIGEAIYQVGDEYWSVAEARWVAQPAEAARVIVLGGPATVENLRETLLFYGARDPSIRLGCEIMSEEEKFARLREERARRLAEYDQKVRQLDREIRIYPDNTELVDKRAAWDAYAMQLCELPDESGAPWDGGGEATPWPEKPAQAS